MGRTKPAISRVDQQAEQISGGSFDRQELSAAALCMSGAIAPPWSDFGAARGAEIKFIDRNYNTDVAVRFCAWM